MTDFGYGNGSAPYFRRVLIPLFITLVGLYPHMVIHLLPAVVLAQVFGITTDRLVNITRSVCALFLISLPFKLINILNHPFGEIKPVIRPSALRKPRVA